MPYFRGDVCGEGFPGSLIGVTGQVGFFAARYLQAGNEEEARKLLLEALWREPELNVLQGAEGTAKIIIEQIFEVDAAAVKSAAGNGFTFFSERS
jgi:hypothetical protein